jgi:rod shape-determining protein MreC
MKLQKELASLRAELFATKELSKENLRLKKLLQLTASLPGKKVSARIVGRDASSDFKVLRINKGFSHGIELQSTVVTSEGVVGYIYQMTEHYADVLTLLDSNNHLDAIVGRTRTHGIVEGHTGNKCIMKYVSRPVPLILGDIILTSGLGNVYPKGLKIGIVSRIEKESYGITQDIEVTPSVDFTKLEEVVVLVKPSGKKMNKEWEALNNNSSEDNK